jgi:hypothetical protein
MTVNTSAVPRSGCNMISINGKAAKPRRMYSRRLSMSPKNPEATLAMARMSPSLANSDGCSWNEPSWNHDCAPLVFEPNGDTTISSNAHAPP